MENIIDQEIKDLIILIKDKIKNLKEYNINQNITTNQRLSELKESIAMITKDIDSI